MISDQIKDVKHFMSKLLIGDSFDDFLVNEVSITTFNIFHIDGHINESYYSKDEQETLSDSHLSSWKMIKKHCFEIIKGNKTPVRFKIIFAMNRKQIEQILSQIETSYTLEDINELFLNIKYENATLSYITGTSLKIFSMDKSLEKAFDSHISSFISTLFD